MKKNILEISAVLIIFIIIFLLVTNIPIINRFKNNGDLIINEIMPSNKYTFIDDEGNHYDYIELYNGYDHDINLEGYYLSDDSFNLKKWSFPKVSIAAKSYLLIYASGLDKYENEEIHTNFKLSTKGEVLTLSDNKANPISRILYLGTESDTSYGYNGKSYVYFYKGTPGKINNSKYSESPIELNEISDKSIIINEYLTDNNNVSKSKLGYYSLIELYNVTNKDINIENYYLSDNYNNRFKYQFPDITIKANSYLVVYASGLDKYENEEIHTNFVLNSDDGTIILSNEEKQLLDKVSISPLPTNISKGYYQDAWVTYNYPTFGSANDENYVKEYQIEKDLIINEVSSVSPEAIELKNITEEDINLKDYSIGDKSGKIIKLPDKIIKSNSYYVINGGDSTLNINNSTEVIYLYKNNILIDTFEVGRLTNGISTGLNDENKKVYYKNITMGNTNSQSEFIGYAETPNYSVDGGYVDKGTKITLSTGDASDIYYTTNGSFPNKDSKKYTEPIEVSKTTVIKAIAYKDNYIESDIISRTFITDRKHDVAIVSISTDYNNLFGYNGIINNYRQDSTRKINFEFYESNGNLGVSFVGDTKLAGADSRERPQKSMSIYLRKEYGLQEVTYPFFKDNDTITYSSFLLRNAGEDPKGIRIMDTALTRTLKGQMDIDIQDSRPVVVYINGEYYGLYNLREKFNEDYVVSTYGVEKGKTDLIKYSSAVKGNTNNYNSLVNYILNHNCRDKEVYDYIKSQLDVQELINYWIAESYYGNTDLGNIRYYRYYPDGKWRFMLYDLDWSMWNSNIRMGYPVLYQDIPAVTYLYSSINITRKLYQNEEFKDLYLKTLAYHLKNTFNPTRMNGIVDELASEIKSEMPYHISRWSQTGMAPTSMDRWNSGLSSFKNMITNRYNATLYRVKSDFNLSNDEYNKYFGELK